MRGERNKKQSAKKMITESGGRCFRGLSIEIWFGECLIDYSCALHAVIEIAPTAGGPQICCVTAC